jgi:hypothetical protein
MEIESSRIEQAARITQIIRHPRQHLSTFGVTNIQYFMVTEPSYSDLTGDINETVLREGKVIAERPKIVTPYYLSRLEGFSPDVKRYFNMLLETQGADAPGLFYAYKNETKGLNIISESWRTVVERLNTDIDKSGDPLTAIIKGQDDLWDVSLFKFIYELTRHSLQDNINQLGSRGLFNADASGIPADARMRIEELFTIVARGESSPSDLEAELNRWGVFELFQDRFFSVVRNLKR